MDSHRFLIVLTLSTVARTASSNADKTSTVSPGGVHGERASSLKNNLRGGRYLQGGEDDGMPLLTAAGRINICAGDW